MMKKLPYLYKVLAFLYSIVKAERKKITIIKSIKGNTNNTSTAIKNGFKEESMGMNICGAPCCWGVDDVKNPYLPSWKRVLKEAGEAGYRALN